MQHPHADAGASASPRLFVGRAAELDELSQALERARSGHGQLVLISGEPGIGKTRLLDELAARASLDGVPLLWGRCWEAGGMPSYFPWLAIVGSAAALLDDAALEAALLDGAPLLAELVPALRSRVHASAGALAGSAEEQRFRLFRAVVALLRKVASQHAAIVLLDDLHAADESSLRLLQFVARELRSLRLFVLGTYRDVEARLSPEIASVLGQITRDASSLALARLPEAEATRFVRARAAALDARAQHQLFLRTQGNPLFLEQMLQLLAVEGDAALESDALPLGVREVIRQRLARISPEVRPLLELAAVRGDEVEPALLADAAGLSALACERALHEAAQLGVLHARKSNFRFAHALLREVLERGLPAARRAELHQAIAHALERKSKAGARAPHAELAHHWLEASSSALARAVEHAVPAAEQALALFAFEDAIALLTRVEAAIERDGSDPLLAARVLIALGRAQIRRGAGAQGRSACLRAAELARKHDEPSLLAQAALAYGLEITAALIDPLLISMLKEALAGLPEGDTALSVQVKARLAAAMQPQRDLAYPIALAKDAIAAARRLGEPPILLDALHTGMSAMMDISDPRERMPLNFEIEQLATQQNDRERLLHTQVRLVFDHMELGDLAGADARIARFERLAKEAGAQRYLWRVPLFHSMRALVRGEFAAADALSQEARSLGEAAEDPQLERCYVFHREGLLRAWEQHERMIAFDPEARTLSAALYTGPHWQNGGSALTHARVEDRDGTRRYLALIPEDDWPLVQNPTTFMHLGEALSLVGAREPVERLYALLAPAAHRCVSWGFTKFLWDGPATRVLGLLAARLERFELAEQHFEQALRELERIGAWPYLARTRYEYGRALLARGGDATRTRARALFDAAAAAATELGMSGLERLVARAERDARDQTRAQRDARDQTRAQRDARDQTRAQRDARDPAQTPVESDQAHTTAGLPFAFVAGGEVWTVYFGDTTFSLRSSLGLQYLTRLFAAPGHAIHALELSGGAEAGAVAVDAGDAGELLDETARNEYKARLHALRTAEREAEADGDAAAAERAREEIEFLAAELSRAVGLSGRARRGGSSSERARSAVQRRIRNAIERVREQAPALAELLERSVKTGIYCEFRPELASRR